MALIATLKNAVFFEALILILLKGKAINCFYWVSPVELALLD